MLIYSKFQSHKFLYTGEVLEGNVFRPLSNQLFVLLDFFRRYIPIRMYQQGIPVRSTHKFQ